MHPLKSWNTLEYRLGIFCCPVCGRRLYYCYALVICDGCILAWNVNPFRPER